MLVLGVVLIFGDAMYVGLWYYIVVPLGALIIALPFKPRPLFLCGLSLGIVVTFFSYLSMNYFSKRPDGLIILGHLFSLPGAALGVIFSAFLARKKSKVTILGALLLGVLGVLIGFYLNQLINCNIGYGCGPLSFKF